MANELTTQIITRLKNPTSSTTQAILNGIFDQGQYRLTQTTKAIFGDVVTVGTGSEQDLALPADSKFTALNQGLFCAINLDPTNYVILGPKTGGGSLQLLAHLWPKTPVQIPIAPNVVLRWQAVGGACDVAFVWFAK